MAPGWWGLIIAVEFAALSFIVGHGVGYVRAMKHASRALDAVIGTVRTRS